jgi:mono/diheme cytochrome c family protein
MVIAFAFTTVLSANAAPGEELWIKHCKMCHGSNGDGDTMMGKRFQIPDYTDPEAQSGITDEAIRTAIVNGLTDEKGRRTMLAFGDRLTDEEIDILVAYFRSLADNG